MPKIIAQTRITTFAQLQTYSYVWWSYTISVKCQQFDNEFHVGASEHIASTWNQTLLYRPWGASFEQILSEQRWMSEYWKFSVAYLVQT